MQVPPCAALRCGIGRYRLRICHASWLPSDLRRAPSHDGSRLSRGSVRALVVCTEQLPCRSPKRLFPRHVLRVRGTSNAGVEDVYSRSLRTGGGFAPPDVPDRGVVSGRGRAMARCRRRRWGVDGRRPARRRRASGRDLTRLSCPRPCRSPCAWRINCPSRTGQGCAGHSRPWVQASGWRNHVHVQWGRALRARTRTVAGPSLPQLGQVGRAAAIPWQA